MTTQTKPFPLRMPDELREQIAEIAASNKRSLNAEIIARLEQSLKLPAMMDRVVESFKAVDAGHDKKDDLMERMVELIEMQKALGDQQQRIIDQLLSAEADVSFNGKK